MKFNIFTKEKSKRIVSEERHHKHSHVGYYAKKMIDGSIEFWAHPVTHKCFDMEIKACQPTYLGMYDNEELEKSEDFYDLEISVQRGANKMWQMMGIYE